MAYKLTNNLLPGKISWCLKTTHVGATLEKQLRYMTRNKKELNIPPATISNYRKSFMVKAISLNMKLPQDTKKMPYLSSFVKPIGANKLLLLSSSRQDSKWGGSS